MCKCLGLLFYTSYDFAKICPWCWALLWPIGFGCAVMSHWMWWPSLLRYLLDFIIWTNVAVRASTPFIHTSFPGWVWEEGQRTLWGQPFPQHDASAHGAGKVPVLPVFLVRNTSVFFILEELLDVCHFPLKCICFPHCFRISLHVSALFLLWPLLGILPSLPCCDMLLMGQPWLEALLFSRGSG